MRRQRTKRKIVIIWVDAGTFNVINPLLKRGKIPAFHRIMEEGTSGQLISTMPPHTAPAWASFATGVNPGKHGVYGFWHIEKGASIIYNNSYSIRRETLWSMLNEENKKVILINAPMTYPPRKIDGIVVTGLMTPSDIPYTYPKNIRRKLLREIPEYRVYTRTNAYVNEQLYLEEAYNLLKARRDATLYLMKNYDWDVLFSAFYYTDQIQHVFWKYMDQTHPAYDPDAPEMFKEAITKAYEIVDDSIRKILKIIDEDTLLIVMSDHGAGPVYKYVFINNYLRKLGLITISGKGIMKFALEKLRITDELLLHLSEYAAAPLRAVFKKMWGVKESQSMLFAKSIDWAKTKTFSAGVFGQLWVNYDKIKSTSEYENLINYLTEKLYDFRDPENGEKIVDKVFRRSQIYRGQYVNMAPDLFFVTREMTYIEPGSTIPFSSNQIVRSSRSSGDHRMEGILIMYGKDVKGGYALRDCNIMDLAPTILYLMTIKVPSDVDGKVLVDAFNPSYVREHPVRQKKVTRISTEREQYALSKEEEKKVLERLKALGYME